MDPDKKCCMKELLRSCHRMNHCQKCGHTFAEMKQFLNDLKKRADSFWRKIVTVKLRFISNKDMLSLLIDIVTITVSWISPPQRKRVVVLTETSKSPIVYYRNATNDILKQYVRIVKATSFYVIASTIKPSKACMHSLHSLHFCFCSFFTFFAI